MEKSGDLRLRTHLFAQNRSLTKTSAGNVTKYVTILTPLQLEALNAFDRAFPGSELNM